MRVCEMLHKIIKPKYRYHSGYFTHNKMMELLLHPKLKYFPKEIIYYNRGIIVKWADGVFCGLEERGSLCIYLWTENFTVEHCVGYVNKTIDDLIEKGLYNA